MKKLLLTSILFLAALSSFAQSELPPQNPMPTDSVTGKVIYKSIQKIDSASKDELYSRAKVWIATTFNSANDVIQLDDKTNGQIIIKGKYSFTITQNLGIAGANKYESYTPLNISIGLKEGKYKIEITDLVLNMYTEPDQYVKGGWNAYNVDDIYPISKSTAQKMFKKLYIQGTNFIDVECSGIISSFNSAMTKPTIQKSDW